jgi:hypothetical protein
VHGQRISRAELVVESRAELEQSGAANFLRGEYISEVCKLVVNNPEPLFAPHQPQVRASRLTHPHWANAYELVAKFLIDNKLELTQATADREFPAIKGRRSAAHGALPLDAQIRDLMASSDHSQDFSDRVRKHAEADAQPRTPERASPKGKSGSPRKVMRRRKGTPDEKPKGSKRIRGKAHIRQSPPAKHRQLVEDGDSSASLAGDE